ncbi:ABC transporter permease [Bergeyella sp. RCAD1439]|uniref:ABC transporter permease n=1 Tax=Bergeyella anatis TaxID=3113737 RepID=UPI002E1708D8|nr:ABC transporter permease [Bergeyella sp. RCAD1439]
MFRNWLKIAFVNYKKNRLSTFINLFGLTVGLTGFMLILLHWNDEADYERWNPGRENIYYLQQYYKTDNWVGGNTSYQMVKSIIEELPEVEDYVMFAYDNSEELMVAENGKSHYARGGQATSENFFAFFPFKLKYGRYDKALSDYNKMAISEELSRQLFGDANPVGKQITYGDRKYMVTSVYEIPKENTVVKPNFLFLSQTMAEDVENIKEGFLNWGNYSYQALLKLKPGADVAGVEQAIFDKVLVGKRYSKEVLQKENIVLEEMLTRYGPNKFYLTRLDKMRLEAKSEGGFKEKGDFKTIKILFGLAVLILVLSAINFINLKMAQGSQRAKEVGVKKAIGSRKSQLVGQFVMETVLLCAVAYLLSLALVELLLPSFNKFLGKSMRLDHLKTFVYSAAMTFGVALFSGLVPAFYLSSFKPINTLKGNFSRSSHGVWLRNGILTFQLLISSFFLIAGLIIHQQVNHMMAKDLGFNGNQTIIIYYSNKDSSHRKYERLKNEIKKINGVEDVTFGEATPTTGGSSSNMDWRDKSIMAQHGAMDYNFFDFFDMKIVKGRNLSPQYASDTVNTVLVNEAFVRQMGWTNDEALKNEVKPGFDEKNYKIVGVVRDYDLWGVKDKTPAIAFFHYLTTKWKRHNMYFMEVKLGADDIEGTLARLKTFWETKGEPGYPFNYGFVDKTFAKTFVKYQKQQTLFGLLNAVVLTVAMLGLFALSSLLIEQKLKDVAVKKALGASAKIIVFDLTRRFLLMALAAVLVSIPISYYFMNEWLKDFAYRIEMPWWPYGVSLGVMLLLTFAVVSFKAYRATRVNLVKYLKYE